jgi:hypothetical protein
MTCIVGQGFAPYFRHGIVSGRKFGVAKSWHGLNRLCFPVAILAYRWWVVVSIYELSSLMYYCILGSTTLYYTYALHGTSFEHLCLIHLLVFPTF